jgi:hypothetical protein
MTSRDFCYWLQGYFEICPNKSLNAHQVEIIKKHLAMVFVHEIDPSFGATLPELQTIHDNVKQADKQPAECPRSSIDHIKFTC